MLSFCLTAFGQQTPVRISVQSGNWTNKNTWNCNCVPASTDDAVIAAGHAVTFVGNNNFIRNLTVESGGLLNDNGNSNTVTGNFTVNGTYSGSGNINLTGSETSIDGSGNISNTGSFNIIGNKSILSTANLIKGNGDVNILGDYTITNHGTITIGGNVKGTVEGSTWVNAANATLNIGGTPVSPANNPLLYTGTLDASAEGNTINYYSPGAITIKLPKTVSGVGVYYHLIISGANTKTLPNGSVAIAGDLTIRSALNGNGSEKFLYVRGNWMNEGNFIPGAGTVVFDGNEDQSITNVQDEDFNHLTVNKPTGKLILNANVAVASNVGSQANRSTLTMLSGNVDAGSYNLTLGRKASDDEGVIYTGILEWSSGTIVGTCIRWINHEWSPERTYFINEIVLYNGQWWKSLVSNNSNTPAEGTHWTAAEGILFPVGTSAHYRPARVVFNDITPGSLAVNFVASHPGSNGLPLVDEDVTVYNTFADGYWSLTAANSLNSTNYDIELTGNGFAAFGIKDDTRILTRVSSGTDWLINGSHGGRNGNTLRRNGMNVLSAEFCFADDTNCSAPATSPVDGKNNVCAGDTETYSVSYTEGSTYAWNVTGGTIVHDEGESITVDWDSAGTVGSVSVVESNACTIGETLTVSVNVHSIPPVLTGKLNVPENGDAAVLYSVSQQDGYTYGWQVTGGTIESGEGTSSISVKWGSAGTRSICVEASYNTCETPAIKCEDVVVYKVISSIKNGTWNDKTKDIWDCNCVPTANDNVTIKNLHTITIGTNDKISAKHLTIEAGGTLKTGSNTTRTVTITGDLNIYGTLSGPKANIILASGVPSPVIDGTGNITDTTNLNILSARTILSTASLTKREGNITLADGVIVTNNSNLTVAGDIIGASGNSTWINAANATLTIGGALLTSGALDASAAGNTIHYNGETEQFVKLPGQEGQYHNISFSGPGTKILPSNTLLIKANFSNDAILNAGTGTVNFNGVSSIAGNTPPEFNNLVVSGSLISSHDTIRIGGNFINHGTFHHNSGVVNFSGLSSVSGNSETSFNHVVVTGTLNAPVASLTVEGDFTNHGTFNHNGGIVKFDGSNVQNISANNATFNNLMINKPTGSVTLLNFLNLRGLLSMQSATTFTSDGNLTLLSTGDNPAVDGSIGPLPEGASVQGDVTVQRYFRAADDYDRFVSSPVTNATVAQLQQAFAVTGGFAGTSYPCAGCKNDLASLHWYDESIKGEFKKGYTPFPGKGSSSDQILIPGVGYDAFMWNGVVPATVNFKGPINKGNISLGTPRSSFVTYTQSTPASSADGWNLVGNPYPSAIQWNNGSGWNKTNIDPTVWVWDVTGRIWRTFNANTSVGDLTNGIIATGQGFWIKVLTPGTGSIVISEQAKSGMGNGAYYRQRSNRMAMISLRYGDFTDNAFIIMDEKATENFDFGLDAEKLELGIERLSVSILDGGGRKLAHYAINKIFTERIPLHVFADKEGEYELMFSSFNELGFDEFYLLDTYLGKSIALSSNTSYSFSVGADNLSNTGRFFLSKTQPTFNAEQQIGVHCYPNPVSYSLVIEINTTNVESVSVTDNVGRVLNEILMKAGEGKSKGNVDMTDIPAGLYFIKAKVNGKMIVEKIVKQ